MTYALTLIYSIFITSFCRKIWIAAQKTNFISYCALSLSYTIPWILVCGSQYNTGTDYGSYIQIFSSGEVDLFYNKSEFLFAKIVEIYHSIGFHPQGLYFIFYSVGFIFFILCCYKINNQTLFIFIILYFCVSNLFINQLNGLRQSIAVYIITYATLCLNSRKGQFKFVLLVFLGSLFHASSWFSIVILLFYRIKLNAVTCRIILLISILIIVSGTSILNLAIKSFTDIIPSIYLHYLTSSFNQEATLIQMLPKLILFPLFYFSTDYLRIERRLFLRKLYIIGILCYAFRLFTIQNVMLDRLGYIFILLAIMPLYLYWTYLFRAVQLYKLEINILVVITLFFVKVLLIPKEDYIYNSIFFETLHP